jgi:uncharacterized protein (TIGR02246 family)
MKKILMVIPLVILMCFTFSCQKGEEVAEYVVAEQKEPKDVMDLAQVRQLIEETNVKFGEAVRSGDATALASLYTEDAKLLPPNSEMILGREGIEAFWGGGLQMGIKDAVLTTVEVLGIGDMVCEIGRYDLTIQPEGQEAVEDSGKFLVIWKKVATDTWKLHVDIWNTSLPAQ